MLFIPPHINCRSLHHPKLTLPIPLFPVNTFQINVSCFRKIPLPWLLSNFPNSVAIPNEMQVSEDSKLTLYMRDTMSPFSVENDSFHFHPFPSKFHFYQLHITPLYKYAMFSISIYQLMGIYLSPFHGYYEKST